MSGLLPDEPRTKGHLRQCECKECVPGARTVLRDPKAKVPGPDAGSSPAASTKGAKERIDDSEVEEFIQSMRWSPDAGDYEKTLVMANVRAFAGFINQRRLR